MATALTEYLTMAAASSTLSTANAIIENATTGATTSNKNTNLVASTTGWVMFYSQGQVTGQSGAGSEIAPNASGWCDDANTLNGMQFVAGNWTFTLQFEATVAGTYTADVHFRAYRYTPTGSIYTLVCEAVATAQTIASASYTTVNASVSGAASPKFNTGDKLYIDCQHNITTNSAAPNVRMNESSSATVGTVNAQVVTPGYQVYVPPSSGVVIINDGYGGLFS